MLTKLYPYRFEIFFFSLVSILFGSLIIPLDVYENKIAPFIFLGNILAGILLISRKKKTMWFFIVLLLISSLILGADFTTGKKNELLDFIRMTIYFLYYIVITNEIIKQVWYAKEVNKTVIFGLVSGYISLGLIGFFICLSIEMAIPGSFYIGNTAVSTSELLVDNLMYYSYITLLTVGYGDILPNSIMAQKSSMLIGLMGQIYLVVITGIVVGKYISQSTQNK